MTRKELERQTRQADILVSLGFTSQEAESLRRISMTLHRWYEMECGDGNGYIERDEKTGIPRYFNANARFASANDPRAWSRIADRETGAIKRLTAIIHARNTRYIAAVTAGTTPNNTGLLSSYLQTDPRGASLYILRPGDVPAGADVSSYYSRGIVVY